MNAEAHIVDVDAQNFADEVIEASRSQLVMIDFWADWCGPCKSLAPILESLVAQYGGALKLAKVDTDKHQELAAHFGIRSLPTVFFFKDGQPVDQFMGVQPESEIKAIIDKHAPTPPESDYDRAMALYEAGEVDAAIPVLNQFILDYPSNDEAKIKLVEWLVDLDRMDDANALLQAISEEGQKLPEYKALIAKMEFANSPGAGGDTAELEAKVNANPDDLETRFEFANALIGTQQLEEALQQLLEIIKRDANFRDGEPKQTMIKVFELCGGSGGIVSTYRRQLNSLLN